jgi:hypothetical protein
MDCEPEPIISDRRLSFSLSAENQPTDVVFAAAAAAVSLLGC